MPAIGKIALALPFIALAFAGAANASGPSFSCRGALRLPEWIICRDPNLSALDRRVSRLYHDAGGPSDADPEVRDYVRDALDRRNDCSTARCIRRILNDEIDYLENHQDDDSGY